MQFFYPVLRVWKDHSVTKCPLYNHLLLIIYRELEPILLLDSFRIAISDRSQEKCNLRVDLKTV